MAILLFSKCKNLNISRDEKMSNGNVDRQGT